MLQRRDLRSDAGATLVEMLVALSILSIAGVAILAGIEGGIRTADLGRKQSVGGANVRNYAEAVQDWVASGHYDPCGGGVNYTPATVGFTKPAGYTPAVEDVTALAGDGSEIPCADDEGVQRVRFTMTSEDPSVERRATEELVVILRDPCAPGGAAGC
ncbi:MAG: type II secretion system protein [Propionibacteriales bacterium]|nr:type II secretion system protein [Propionibacteriales bacterium]